MSRDQRSWSLTPSTLMPSTLQFRFSNSFLSPAKCPSSVVHTGVKLNPSLLVVWVASLVYK